MSTYRLPIKKAADAFGLSYSLIYRAVVDGDLPAVRFRSRWLVRPEDVEAWITENGTSNQPQ